MKKKIFMFVIALIMLIPFANVYAEEVRTFTINTTKNANGDSIEDGLVKDGSYYGGFYDLWSSTTDINKYDTIVSICNMEGTICNTENDPNYTLLKPGTYKVGFRVVGKEGYETTVADKWIINGEEMEPSQCGSTNNNDVGCENFFTVTILDWKAHISEFKFETKTDYKPGDTVDNTVKVTSENGDIIDAKVYWFESLNDAYPGSSKAITKFGKGIYYLAIQANAEKGVYFDIGDRLYLNGKQYYVNDTYAAMGDYNFFYIVMYKLDLTDVKVEPEDTSSEEEKQAAEEISKVLSQALDDLSAGNDVKGITEEVANKVKEAVEAGKTIVTKITSEPIKLDDLDEDVKKSFEEKTNKDDNIIGYFDINLAITSDGEELGKITELQDKIGITVDITDLIKDLPKVEDGKSRFYKVLRIHDGVVEELNCEYKGDNTLTIYTDKFSNYAIVYEDVDIEEASNPETGDNIILYVSVLGLSIIGLVVIKKRFN